MKYRQGDQVLLVHRDTKRGDFGISDRDWGKIYTVTDITSFDDNFIVSGHGHRYAVWADMIEPAGGPW